MKFLFGLAQISLRRPTYFQVNNVFGNRRNVYKDELEKLP